MGKPTTDYVASSRKRLDDARRIADGLRHDPSLHRLAMTAVFVLEDCHETLSRCEMDGRRTQVDDAAGKAPKGP